MDGQRQPLLHDAALVLAAPAQVWSRMDGSMASPVDGWYLGDVRVLSVCELQIAGATGDPVAAEPVRTERLDTSTLRVTSLLRGLDDGIGADPQVRLDRVRRTTSTTLREEITISSSRGSAVDVDAALVLATDFASMEQVKAGGAAPAGRLARWVDDVEGAEGAAEVRARTSAESITESTSESTSGSTPESITVSLHATGAQLLECGERVVLRWRLRVPARGRVSVHVDLAAHDRQAAVVAPVARVRLTGHAPTPWAQAALADLEALQLDLPAMPGATFFAAGAPWFLTLFGRDSLWTARLLLPEAGAVAEGTLRVLAALQGTVEDPESAEQPGKILHELRRSGTVHSQELSLPPRYYGTVDATPLWVLLLHDAWCAGLPDATLRELLPALRAALAWQRDWGIGRSGFVEYVDASGHGLSNQGWKDSGDSVQWRDGRLAQGPIALCEVQGYAHEAALAGARMLDALGEPGGAQWRAWARDLRSRFRQAFWIEDADHPAIALDASGAAVDSLTSNIGHLVGTGLLDARDEARVAQLLVDERLNSGFGVRTLATDCAGYWPLSYHGGSVWAHDTAIAIFGLMRAGYREQARRLAQGLEAAAAAFGYRMPELHGGDPRGPQAQLPLPYPAACRPQAWSAAAALVAARALVDADPTLLPHLTPPRSPEETPCNDASAP